MKATYSEKKEIKNNVNNESFIQELCHQSPFLIINTPCGVGKYKFNKIGYDKNNSLVLGQCLSAVGWVGGTIPELTEKDGLIEHLCSSQSI